MLKQVYKNYGPYGLYRGFTTSYYSATTAAYLFFIIYKGLKMKMREYFEPKTQKECSLIYMAASFISEAVALCIYYPYEILKVRMIAKNDVFGYKSIPDAFKKIVKGEGPRGIYHGYNYFLINYVLTNTFQMVIYETYMDIKKKKYGNQSFKEHESRYVIEAAMVGGFFSGMIMNSFECIMYMKMAKAEGGKNI
jgi:hypothetical protein